MTVRVTFHLTGVDGETCLVGKESNTKSLNRTIKTIVVKVISCKGSVAPFSSVCDVLHFVKKKKTEKNLYVRGYKYFAFVAFFADSCKRKLLKMHSSQCALSRKRTQ